MAKRILTWQEAWQQAQAEMASPQAVVWLGIETADAIHATQPNQGKPHRAAEAPDRPKRSLTPFVLAVSLLIPLAISYRRAYRQISPALSNKS